jgi:hypothetical protein
MIINQEKTPGFKKASPFYLGLLVMLFISACGSSSTPLDADTRIKIDSIVLAQTTRARLEIDSFCKAAEKNQLPQLIDSIKKVRLKEIQEQLKTVPQ